jgi:hypothetical protein
MNTSIVGKCGCQDKTDWKKRLRSKARRFYVQGTGASYTEEYALDIHEAEEAVEEMLVAQKRELLEKVIKELDGAKWMARQVPGMLKAQSRWVELGGEIEAAIEKIKKL